MQGAIDKPAALNAGTAFILRFCFVKACFVRDIVRPRSVGAMQVAKNVARCRHTELSATALAGDVNGKKYENVTLDESP